MGLNPTMDRLGISDDIGPITVAAAAYTQAVDDLTEACELGFVAKKEYSLHFWNMSK